MQLSDEQLLAIWMNNDCDRYPDGSISQLIKSYKELRAVAERLAKALEDLHDWQNGCPLPTRKWEQGWGSAMKEAEEALAAAWVLSRVRWGGGVKE